MVRSLCLIVARQKYFIKSATAAKKCGIPLSDVLLTKSSRQPHSTLSTPGELTVTSEFSSVTDAPAFAPASALAAVESAPQMPTFLSIRTAKQNQHVIAKKGMRVIAERNSMVVAEEGSFVVALEGSKVVATMGSEVLVQKGSRVINPYGTQATPTKIMALEESAVPKLARRVFVRTSTTLPIGRRFPATKSLDALEAPSLFETSDEQQLATLASLAMAFQFSANKFLPLLSSRFSVDAHKFVGK
jgi:hypothetical protein